MGISRRNKAYSQGIATLEELKKELEFYHNLSKYGTATPTREEKKQIKERQEDNSRLVQSVQ